MKKVLFILALAALASASFADVSITDWGLLDSDTYRYDSDEAFIRDAEPNGFDLYMNPTDRPVHRNADFRSSNISGWVYDEEGEFTVTITGFEDISPNNFTGIAVLLHNENKDAQGYLASYTGPGTYKFNSGNASKFFELSTGDVVADITIMFGRFTSAGSGSYARFGDNTVGSLYVTFGDEEQPETTVPEPCTIAYAVTGLGSLAGIKKRFGK